jgi:hypothetical protein
MNLQIEARPVTDTQKRSVSCETFFGFVIERIEAMKRTYTLVVEHSESVYAQWRVDLLDAHNRLVAENHPDTSAGLEDAIRQIGETLVIFDEEHRELPPDGH